MHATEIATPARIWSAAELRRLPPEQRDAILAAAADRAVHDYLTDPALTAFEAFGPPDICGDTPGECEFIAGAAGLHYRAK